MTSSWSRSHAYVRYVATFGVAVSLAALLTTAPAASTPDLRWHVRPSANVDASGKSYGVFGPFDTLAVELTLTNTATGAAGDVVLAAGFFDAVRVDVVAVDDDRPLASASRWEKELACGGASAASCATTGAVTLRPGQSVTARVRLASAEGVTLRAGEYRLVGDMRWARMFLRDAGGVDLWPGLMIDQGSVALSVRDVSTPADRQLQHQVEAGEAVKQGDLPTALSHFNKLSAEFPDEPAGHAGAGAVLLELGRYIDAATSFERALALTGTDAVLAKRLALSYLALGQATRAESVVRKHLTADAAPSVLASLQQQANRLKTGR